MIGTGRMSWSKLKSRMVEHHLSMDGVILHHRTEIEEILGKKGKVTGVRTTSGEVIRCNMVAVGIGVKACTGAGTGGWSENRPGNFGE